MEIIVYDIEKICKTCLKEHNELISVFETDCGFGENIKICEIIKNLTSLEVTDEEGLPSKICYDCLNDLKKFNEFTKQVHDSDSKLRFYQQALLNAEPADIKDITVTDDGYNEDTAYSGVVHSVVDIKNEETNFVIEAYVKQDKNEEELLKEDYVEVKYDEKDTKNGNYLCLICNKTFKTDKKFEQHKNVHLNSEVHVCPVCAKEFSERTHLKVHMRCHFSDDQKPFKCSECDRRYAYQYQLTQHMFKHADEKPFPCPHCEKGCLTADSLKRHLKIHDVNYEKQKHECEICNKVFPYPSFLAEHMKNHTGEKPFLCSYCGKGFRQKGALKYHIRVHTGNKPYRCDGCNSSFMSQGVLKVHMRRHTNERPYVCDICGRAFRRSTDMRSHRRIHTGDKPVTCGVCSKRMSTTGQLTIHMRMHTGEKPFACSFCNKAFSTKSLVVKHERIHTGERPYTCDICGKSFSQSSSLNTHRKIHTRSKKS